MIKSAPAVELLGYALVVGSVWLAWEIVKAPIAVRAPPQIASRIAPSSSEVLRRAAEAELAANREDSAKLLAEEALLRAPFDARALRVLGLAEARRGNAETADSLLTLAGNWSLRDDPSHAWLVERRLRQGNYASAFAHADTLVRRRDEAAPTVFNLFATAAITDPRALPALVQALAVDPPWRRGFILYLTNRPDADALLFAVGVALEKTASPLNAFELAQVYRRWFEENRLPAMEAFRQQIGRPDSALVQNSDFSIPEEQQLTPFGWALVSAPGMATAILDDDIRGNEKALRAEYDGFAGGYLAEQILFLRQGSYQLSGEVRLESAPSDGARLLWTLSCVESGARLAQARPAMSDGDQWKSWKLAFRTPATGCTAQRLRLETDRGERRSYTVAWYDKIAIKALATGQSE